MPRLRPISPRPAAAAALAFCVAFWFLFDRMYPRIRPVTFAVGEGLALSLAVALAALAWRRERRRGDALLLGAALFAAALYALAAGLGLRWIP